MPATAHSKKALETLNAMGVDPATAKHADVEWRQEEREVLGKVACPACRGRAAVGKLPDGTTAAQDAYASQMAVSDWYRLPVVPCETCRDWGRKYRGQPTGRVKGLVVCKVWVGTVMWPVGTRRDSRFANFKTNRWCCELCSKTLKSWRVPVVGWDAAGTAHGLWVGEDCARKFLPGVHTDVVSGDGEKDRERMVLEEAAA